MLEITSDIEIPGLGFAKELLENLDSDMLRIEKM